jgi:hypothetical protein
MTAQEIAKTFEDCAIDHEPDGWPAVQQKELSEAAAMLRKQAEAIKTLRKALTDCKYGLEGARIWGGMGQIYNPLHPFKYLPLRDKAEAALTATEDLK